MRGKRKKRKADDLHQDVASVDDSDTSTDTAETDKYTIYKSENYCRQYPEDGGNFEYIVIYESSETRPIGDRDLMSLGASLKRGNKGIKRFKRINKYKIGAIFERPGLANSALYNTKTLKDLHLKASIPALLTETTGVIRNVPTYMSNKNICNGLSSSRDVVSVRRLMRRGRDEDGKSCLVPTQTVALTFACPTLPDSVDIDSWYFEVSLYIPPVSQCLRCLRYGHIGKFCKNSQKCTICGEEHLYRDCPKDPKEAICVHCSGNHIAISSDCPIKKKKIEENRTKYQKVAYADLFNEKSFPTLNKSKPTDNIKNLLQCDDFVNLLISSIIKIISLNKSDETPVTSAGIKSILLDTFSTNKNRNKLKTT